MNLGASVIKWIFVGVMAAVPYGLRWFYTGELPSALQPSPIWGGLALCAFSIGVMYYVSRSELYDSYVSTEPFWRKTLNVLMTLAAMAAFLYALVATVSLPFAEAIGDPDLIMRANIISNVGVTATICLLAYLLIVAPKWVVPGGRLVVFGKGSLLYPGEAYRMWPWNVYERRLFSHEERISLPLLELLCEDGTFKVSGRATFHLDIGIAKVANVRTIDPQSFSVKALLREVATCLGRKHVRMLTIGELLKDGVIGAINIGGIPVRMEIALYHNPFLSAETS